MQITEKILALARELGRIETELNATLKIREQINAQLYECDAKIERLDEEKLNIVNQIANLATQNSAVAYSNVREENHKIFHIFKTAKGGGNDR